MHCHQQRLVLCVCDIHLVVVVAVCTVTTHSNEVGYVYCNQME